MFLNTLNVFKKSFLGIVVASLIASGLTVLDATAGKVSSASAAVGVACSSSMTAQNNLRITPSHGSVFYIDSGVTPKVDSAYVAYKIDNSSGSARNNIWVRLSDFTGSNVLLANPADQYQQISVPANGTATAFFLLKSTGATTQRQAHVVSIFDKRPDLSGANSLASCDFGFVKVVETIKASANKITTVTGALSPTTATLGGTYTITVNGQTGKVGNGSSPDMAAIWASPSAYSSWPTRALRLERTEISICVGSNGNSQNAFTLTNQLLYKPTTLPTCLNGNGDYWKGVYTFRIIGTGPSSLAPSPVAIISSGTQYKHSDVAGITSNQTVNLSSVASSNVSVRVNASSAVVASTSSSVTIRYVAEISTTSSQALIVDSLVDQHDPGTTFVSGSVKTGTNSGSLLTAADPSVLAADVGRTPPPYYFIGPFSTVSGAPFYIQYDFVIPCSSTTTTYGTKVFAYTGDVLIGSDSTSISTSNVTTSSSVGCATPTVSNVSTTMTPSAATSPADPISATGATLNGFAYPVGLTGIQSRFVYSTDPNLVSGVTQTNLVSVTGTTAVAISAAITGLTSSTTYYFQAVVRDSGGVTYRGAILSFTTLPQAATPSLTTGAATGISGTTATLNGTLNPNLNALSSVYFRICRDSAMSTGCLTNVTVVTDDGSGTQVNLTFDATAAGNFAVSTDSILGVQRVTGLTLGTTYFYRLSAVCTATTTYCTAGVAVDGNVRTFTSGAPTALTADATDVGGTSATLNGSVNANSNTAAVSFCWSTNPAATNGILTAANCTYVNASPSSVSGTADTLVSAAITGLTQGQLYYFQTRAVVSSPAYTTFGSVFSFRTLQITSVSNQAQGSVGTPYSYSFAGTGGSGSYVWTAVTPLPAGLSLSPSGLLSGTPTTGGTFSTTIRMTDPASGLYVETVFTIQIDNPVNISASPASFTTGVGATVPQFTGSASPANGIAGSLTCSVYTSADTSFASPLTITANTTAGSYVIRCDGVLASGFTPGTNTTAVLTISSPSTVSISANNASFVTGTSAVVPSLSGTASPANGISGQLQCLAYSSTDTSFQTPVTVSSNMPAGTYVIRCTGTPATNFVVSSNSTGFLYVLEPVALAANSASFTTGVGAAVPTFSATANPSAGISGTPNCNVYSQADSGYATPLIITSSSAAGTYVIRCTANAANGYQITSITNGTLTISSPIVVDVSANSASFIRGIGAQVPTLTATISPSNGVTSTNCNAYTDTTFSTTVALTANTAAGTYPIRCSTTLAQNHVYGNVSDATLTVYSPVTIAAANASYISGMANPVPTFTGSASPGAGIVGNLSCSVYSQADTGFTSPLVISNSTASGTYVIRCVGTVALGYQLVTNTTAQLTVNAAVTITFDSNLPSNSSQSTQTDYGSRNLQANPFTRSGYSFAGWATTPSGLASIQDQQPYSFTAAATLYAVWTPDVYTVTFNANTASGSPGFQVATYTVGTSSPIVLPGGAGMTKSVNTLAYSFGGWSEFAGTQGAGGTAVADPYTPTRTITLYAIWVAPGSMTVTFHSNFPATSGLVNSTQTQSSPVAANLASNGFSVSGYTFSGWSTTALNSVGSQTFQDSAQYSFTSNLDLYAQWSIIQYVVDWDTATNGGAASTASTYTYGGSALSIPIPAARTGFNFLGWYRQSSGGSALATHSNGSLSVTSLIPTQDERFYAVWQAQQYSVTWDTATNGGAASTSTSYTYGGSALSIPTPGARTGYNFMGWYSSPSNGTPVSRFVNGALQVTTFLPTQSTTLYAVWQAQQYTVTWDTATNGGAASTASTYTYGGTALSIPIPAARTGYDFMGWYRQAAGLNPLALHTNGSLNVLNMTPTQDERFYAVWQAQQYTVIWDTSTNGGDPNQSSLHTYGSPALSIPVPQSRPGFDFLGWYTSASGGTPVSRFLNGSLQSTTFAPTQSTTVFAQWAVSAPPIVTPPVIVPPVVEPPRPRPPITPVPVILDPGKEPARVTEDGKEVAPPVQIDKEKNRADLKTPDWQISLKPVGENIQLPKNDPVIKLTTLEGKQFEASGSGFLPDSQVHVYLISVPGFIEVLKTDATGAFSGIFSLPQRMSVGLQVLQVSGYTGLGTIRTASLPLLVQRIESKVVKARVFFTPDSTRLTQQSIRVLRAFVAKLNSERYAVTARSVGLVFPVDTRAANSRISSGRAENVANYLRKLGLSAKYIVVGAGRSREAVPESRRVDVTVTYTVVVSG